LSDSHWALTEGVLALREETDGGGEGELSECPRRSDLAAAVRRFKLVVPPASGFRVLVPGLADKQVCSPARCVA
jgi:hypothetical protein